MVTTQNDSITEFEIDKHKAMLMENVTFIPSRTHIVPKGIKKAYFYQLSIMVA
jgi:hypothetical protein